MTAGELSSRLAQQARARNIVYPITNDIKMKWENQVNRKIHIE